MKKVLKLAFILASAATVLEYLLVSGMFTGPLMALIILLLGGANMVFSFREKKLNEGLLYLIATLGLCMGYVKAMLF